MLTGDWGISIGTKRPVLDEILSRLPATLELLAKAMLEFETLSGDEITELMQNGKIDRPDAPAPGGGQRRQRHPDPMTQ